MTLKCIATGSQGNCYILTNDEGSHLIIDAGIPIKDIKKGLDFDIANVTCGICSHIHQDHYKAVNDLMNMGIPVFQPFKYPEQKRMKTTINEFVIESFDVPHNGCENRAFIITIDNTRILYATDFEYIPYNLSDKKIDIALIEMNYQADRIVDMDNHYQHTVLGHAEEKTVIEFLGTIKKSLRKVILCHMSKSGALDRELAMDHIREVIPKFIKVEWAKPGETYNLDIVPF